ncbi:MAG: hypothetical protein U5K79_11310 [Cyclobacteriaceae bacterium]|nr:hypothetical protein [Cyclobacteriaceae bacterium]
MKNVLLAMLVMIGSAIIISSCGEDDPIVAPTLSYSDATLAVGDVRNRCAYPWRR